MRRTQGIVVAIDGPAGSGKSTLAKRVARELGYVLVDTGAIYRAVALLALRGAVSLEDEIRLAAIASDLQISFRFDGDENQVLIGSQDITNEIRTPEVSGAASVVSTLPAVREALLSLQRRLAECGGAVLEGRDIGTVVFPNAEVKIYLNASLDERAHRRHQQLVKAGPAPSYEEVRRQIGRRDDRDQKRALAPLRPAEDALIVDSTDREADDVGAQVVDMVRAKAAQHEA